MKRVLIVLIVMCLFCSCSMMNTITGKEYWDEVCIEPYANFDSCQLLPKKFIQGQKSLVCMTDSTGTTQWNIIWGDECNFKPGEMLYVKYTRYHSPTSGTGGWKGYLINENEHIVYTLFK